jgi:peptide/nickel transport system substrate-binding protein
MKPSSFRAASVVLAFFLIACTSAAPTALFVTATPGPVGISVGEVTSEPFLPFGTATLGVPFPTPVPPTLTPVPYKALRVCMPLEPPTLYEYTSTDSDGAWARAVVLETLRDGPIDHLNFEYQPVLLERLPTLKNGGAKIQSATIREGESIVDSAGNVTLLAQGLRYYDATGAEQVYPGGGSVAAMQMTVTFKLKAGLQWEDGRPLTADDVLFGWQIAKDPANTASDHYLTARILDPVALDTRTVQFTYLPGFRDTLYYVRFPIPFPRHLYGQYGAVQLAANEDVTRHPHSFGPYLMKEWAPGTHITVLKNPGYYRASEGLPHIDEITFRFMTDPAQMVEAMKTGACDVALSPQETFFISQFEAIDQAEAQGTLRSQDVPSTTFEHLDFNISPIDGYRGLAGTKLFEDVRVRQAFAYCINRRELIDVLLRGRSDVPAAYVPASHPSFDRGVTVYPYDPQRGLALLQEAGWRDTNGDGLLDKRGRLSLDYIFGPIGNTLRESVAALLEAQLKTNCGIEIKPGALSRADFFGDFPDGALFGRQYDLAQFAWVGGEDEPSCGLYTRLEWTGLGDGQPDQYGQVGYPGGGNNVGYINPTFDELCLRAVNSLDPAEKEGGHQQAMRLFSQEVPSIILFFRPKIALVRPNVIGFSLDSTQVSALWNAEELDIIP